MIFDLTMNPGSSHDEAHASFSISTLPNSRVFVCLRRIALQGRTGLALTVSAFCRGTDETGLFGFRAPVNDCRRTLLGALSGSDTDIRTQILNAICQHVSSVAGKEIVPEEFAGEASAPLAGLFEKTTATQDHKL